MRFIRAEITSDGALNCNTILHLTLVHNRSKVKSAYEPYGQSGRRISPVFVA